VSTTDGGRLKRVAIRGYRRRDRAEVMAIAMRSFVGLCLDENIEKLFGPLDEGWEQQKRDHVDYDLSGSPHSAFVAIVDDEVVGFVCNRLYRHKLTGHVTNLAVAPEWQGQGVGKALLEASLAHFRDHGMRYARIETLEQNEKACKFYPSAGFQEVGRQIFYVKEL